MVRNNRTVNSGFFVCLIWSPAVTWIGTYTNDASSEVDMRLYITAPGAGLRGRGRQRLEQRLRLILGSWSSHIRRARVSLGDANGPGGGLDRECRIEALIPSGSVCVRALGLDEHGVRAGGRRLVVLVKASSTATRMVVERSSLSRRGPSRFRKPSFEGRGGTEQ